MPDLQWKKLKEIVDQSDNIVFFGGAGVSTESGIPDFRSTDGLYHQEYRYPPETILSHTFFRQNPEEFYRFYRARMLAPHAKPNAAHKKLAQWEKEGKLKAVITQNIDGLHQLPAAKQCWSCTEVAPQLLHEVRAVLRSECNSGKHRGSALRMRRRDQTGCRTL